MLLRYRLYRDGVLTDANSVVLSNEAGTAGVIRTDTSGVVVADGIAMTRQSTGVYDYTFTEPQAGLSYTWYTEADTDEGTVRETFTDAARYVGRYTTEAQLIQFLGQNNVDVDADVDGDGTADAGANQQAIVTAEGTVDFRTGGPFTVTPDTVGSAMLEKWSRYLAAVEIAQKRLGVDATAVQGLRVLREEAYEEMKMYKDGTLGLPGAVPVESDDDEDFVEPGTFENVTMTFEPADMSDEFSG